MATGTAAKIPAPRQDPRQVTNSLRKTVNFNDAGIAAGVNFDASLPLGAFITSILCEIVTVFNAATTNVLTVGTVNTPPFNNIIAAADVNEGATGVTSVATGLGRSIASAADVTPVAQYTQTGGAATTGQAVIVILYEGGWAS